MTLVSPTTGRRLTADTAHSLIDATGERWPVCENIPYLRTGRDGLIAEVLALLDRGEGHAALARLLADQDDWWRGPTAEPGALARLVAERNRLSLREAMALLGWGPVADYFAHRWSDPTYLAGLALLGAHWIAPATVFELACGIGHYLREVSRTGATCLGADIVFAKCWVARNWVAPEADYVVFDAGSAWPIAGQRFDFVHCQDAFYFLPDQAAAADALRAATAPGGVLAIGHLHNADVAEGAFGPARTAAEWEVLFRGAAVYDEAELRRAMMHGAVPNPTEWSADAAVEAWSVVEGGGTAQTPETFALPLSGANLRPNPLIGDGEPLWPSQRYAREYGAAATWTDGGASDEPARDRRVLDLPERW